MKRIFAGILAVLCLGLSIQSPVLANGETPAANSESSAATGSGGSFGQHASQGLGQVAGESRTTAGDIIKKIIDFMLFAVGLVAVIMIIYGGIQYTTSAGDSGKIASAKNTIIYSIVGLVVAILAYAIVNLVVSSIGSSGR